MVVRINKHLYKGLILFVSDINSGFVFLFYTLVLNVLMFFTLGKIGVSCAGEDHDPNLRLASVSHKALLND